MDNLAKEYSRNKICPTSETHRKAVQTAKTLFAPVRELEGWPIIIILSCETSHVCKRPAKSSWDNDPVRRYDRIINNVWSVSSVHARCKE